MQGSERKDARGAKSPGWSERTGSARAEGDSAPEYWAARKRGFFMGPGRSRRGDAPWARKSMSAHGARVRMDADESVSPGLEGARKDARDWKPTPPWAKKNDRLA